MKKILAVAVFTIIATVMTNNTFAGDFNRYGNRGYHCEPAHREYPEGRFENRNRYNSYNNYNEHRYQDFGRDNRFNNRNEHNRNYNNNRYYR